MCFGIRQRTKLKDTVENVSMDSPVMLWAADIDPVLRSRAARVSPGSSFMVKNKKLGAG